ncbi:hypothetical protein BH24ACT5_BH24ACT5_15000 [soil metagenome]
MAVHNDVGPFSSTTDPSLDCGIEPYATHVLGAPPPSPSAAPPPPPKGSAASWPAPTGARAGWYPDAHVPGGLRYYDGLGWTYDRVGAAPTVVPVVPHPVLPARAGVGAVLVLMASLVTSSALLDAVADET